MSEIFDTPKPLGALYCELTDSEIAILQRIDHFDLGFLHEKVLETGNIPIAELENAIREFKRYIALLALGYENLPVPNKLVDEVWHTLILFTREYFDFCRSTVGTFIHHSPLTRHQVAGVDSESRLAEAYFRVFGSPAPVRNGEQRCCSTCRGLTMTVC